MKSNVVFIDSKRPFGGAGEIIEYVTRDYHAGKIKSMLVVAVDNDGQISWGASGFPSYLHQIGAIEHLKHCIMNADKNE